MRLTVIGCSGSTSGPASPSSCYLVQAEGPDGFGGTRTWSVVLDLGSGAFGGLLEHVEPAEIDAVALTHLHADHVVDVAGLHVYLRYHPQGPRGPVRVLGPEGTDERIRDLVMAGDDEPVTEQLAIEEWPPGGAVQVGPLRLEAAAVRHPVPAVGIRVTGPREGVGDAGDAVLLYTGDTDSCPGVEALADGADVLLAEAAFEENRESVRGIHLTGRRAGELAQGRAGRLVLTHLPPWTRPEVVRAEAEAVFDGPIDMAEPGATWEL
ncbi:beta-lactamase domain protein [Beutenbergia cavernae DSM 12333]|uniref:Beta-lactamase domain protein n=1 Tax=Beutenbergia cavernae (strain ATCC BAA-8 / DSM 12333 / CCUG 43141 / JCM 11478 / NBRC 16432 / NCIMB 13614 / HKI 0122) TaxID=471853 RepID=C5BY81_BEUC1|nr:MBL fold metallo-hydrolase [Beutenbergia cavernae]ACQ80981.1 beta-lactamase domain protein [Beutenbergia cavernae DSM 12333]